MINEEKWYVAQAPYMTESIRSQVEALEYETFLPVLKNKLLTFNYIFIRGERRKIENSLKGILRVHLLYKRPGVAPGKSYGNYERKPMTIGDNEMEMFIRTVSLYKEGAPIVDVKDLDLQKGDTVRITGGAFAGVEGTLITQKGKEGGKVVVSISHLVAVTTVDIEPQYIQVLKFGAENKHIYRKVDTVLPKAKQMMEKRRKGMEITSDERAEMQRFINNYSMAETETLNMCAKLKTLTFMAYVILGIDDYAAKAYRQLKEEILPKIKSERVKALIEEQMQAYQDINYSKFS